MWKKVKRSLKQWLVLKESIDEPWLNILVPNYWQLTILSFLESIRQYSLARARKAQSSTKKIHRIDPVQALCLFTSSTTWRSLTGVYNPSSEGKCSIDAEINYKTE